MYPSFYFFTSSCIKIVIGVRIIRCVNVKLNSITHRVASWKVKGVEYRLQHNLDVTNNTTRYN